MLGHVGSSISSSHTRRERFSAWRCSSSQRTLCKRKHTGLDAGLTQAGPGQRCGAGRYLSAVLGSVGAGRFEAGQHLQQVEECGEVGLLQQQQHGNVLLLRGRQTRRRQLNTLALPLPPRSAQRHEHHLTAHRKSLSVLCSSVVGVWLYVDLLLLPACP